MAAGAGATLAIAAADGEGGRPAPVVVAVVAQAAANRARAAAWIAGQVSPDVTVTCDPAMCGQLRDRGVPAARQRTFGWAGTRTFVTGLVVVTPAVRTRLSPRLAAIYAPLVIASFGTGAERVDVRVVAPDGAAAFRARLASGRAAATSSARQLLRNRNLRVAPQARAAMLAGRVDSRLLVTLAALTAQVPVRLVALTGLPPGASSAVPMLGADIGVSSPTALSSVLEFLRAQRAPYRPAEAAVARSAGGQTLVTVRFDAPSPVDAGSP